jgi:hypothetical protein
MRVFHNIKKFVCHLRGVNEPGKQIIIEPLNSGQIFQTLSAVLLENWLMAYSRKNSGRAYLFPRLIK